MLRAIGGVRRALYARAQELGSEFYSAREDGRQGEFVALNFSVTQRSGGRSITIGWFTITIRGGSKSRNSVKRSKHTGHTDIHSLKQACPEWLYPHASRIEGEARVIREILEELTSAERRAKVIADRAGLVPDQLPDTGVSGLDKGVPPSKAAPSPDTATPLPGGVETLDLGLMGIGDGDNDFINPDTYTQTNEGEAA